MYECIREIYLEESWKNQMKKSNRIKRERKRKEA
jgi:hypothetical protein